MGDAILNYICDSAMIVSLCICRVLRHFHICTDLYFSCVDGANREAKSQTSEACMLWSCPTLHPLTHSFHIRLHFIAFRILPAKHLRGSEQKSSILWFAKFLFKSRMLFLLAGKLIFQETAGKQDPFSKVITVCVHWRLTCSLSGIGMRHTCLLIFKAKFRNLSMAEIW